MNGCGAFYIVATPIGNLQDITLRALEVLQQVDLILCEDTRVTSILLHKHLICKKLMVYNDHSDEYVRQKILDKLQAGQNIALVSDAGTPLIADPGYKLILQLRQAGIKISTLPGPCSAIAALTLSGIPTDRFMFVGFLPHKTAAKKTFFAEINHLKASLVCFESANRLLETLDLMLEYFANREIAVIREISKIYEEAITGDIQKVIDYYQSHLDKLRGEIVICIAPLTAQEQNSDEAATAQLKDLIGKMSLRDAVDIVASQFPIPKKNIYKLALKLVD